MRLIFAGTPDAAVPTLRLLAHPTTMSWPS